MRTRLISRLTEQDIGRFFGREDAMTSRAYCSYTHPKSPLRRSLSRIGRDVPHALGNLESILACTKKLRLSPHDFRRLVHTIRTELGKGEILHLDEAWTDKVCVGGCKRRKLLSEYSILPSYPKSWWKEGHV
jgi:hypothetical protein